MNSPLINNIRLFTHSDFVYAKCEAEFEMGVLVYAKGRVYSRPTFDTPACNTYFHFRHRRVYTHEYTNAEFGSAPDWYVEWLAKNDIWGIHALSE